MGRRFSLLLAAAFTIVLALAGAAQAATLSGTLERVRVTDVLAAPGATATIVDPATQRAVETATAGSDGGWSATVPDGVYDVEYAYPAHRSERVTSVLAYGDVRLGAVRFVLDGYARFSGTVSSAGRAVARAAVTLCATTSTSSAGTFTIDCPQGEQRLSIGFGDWTVRADSVPLTADRVMDVRLPSRIPLTVRVDEYETEAPIENAQVVLPELSSPIALADDVAGAELRTAERSEATNAAGEAGFTIFPGATEVGNGYGTITPPTPRHNENWFFVRNADENGLIERSLARFVHVTGTISDANGPRAGVSVGGRDTTRHALTEADGSFSVWVWPTEQFLVVDPDSGDWYTVDLDRSQDRDDVRLTLPRRQQFEIRVVDGDGAPVVGATVAPPNMEARIDWGDGLHGTGTKWFSQTTTDRDGVVRFDALAGARSSAWANGVVTPPAGSSLQRTVFVIDEPTTTVTLTDQPGRVSVRGSIRVGDSGGGAAITLGGDTRTADEYGSFVFAARPGSDRLHASWSADGSAWAIDGPLDVYDRYLYLEARTAPVTVHVRDADGQPVADATVALPRHTVGSLFYELPDVTLSADPAPIVTGADGDAVATVPAGGQPQTMATVTAPGGRTPQTFRLDADGETTVTLAPEPSTVHVSGSVVDADGRAIAPLIHVVIDGQSYGYGEDGTFEADLEPGQHSIYVRNPRLDGTFTATADRRLVIRMPPLVRLAVRALGGDGRAVPGATVLLPYSLVEGTFGDLDSGTFEYFNPSAETAADGVASFSLYAGTASGRPAFVTPPAESGYESTAFDLPPLDRDASIDVQLPGGPVSAGPQIELAVSPDPLVRGEWWSVSRVAVAVTASDDDGVASLACSVDGVARTFTQTRTATTRGGTFYVNSEGRHTAACTAVDGGGRSASQERAINLDLKNPAAPTASPDRAADNVVYGWWRDSVTVSFADNGDPLLADGSAGSGVDPASVTAPLMYDRSGTYTAAGTVADRSGRVSSAGRVTIKVDADAPTSTLTCPANPVTLGGTGSARWQDADAQSGLAGGATGSVALDTSAIGSFEATHAAVDRVGHTTTSTCRYRVVYAFAWRGNLQAAPALNAIAPGVSTQTVWFSIGGDQGVDPIAGGSPQVEPIDCTTGTPSGRGFGATRAGALQRDAVNGRYGIPWSVAADLPSGGCAALRLQLVDGVEREVRFAR